MRIRPLVEDDLDWLSELFADGNVTRHLATGRLSGEEAREFAREFIDDSLKEFAAFDCGAMAVEHREDGLTIGYGGLRTLPDIDHCAELIYALSPGYWGQGLASEAAGAIVAWGFREFTDLNEIIALARPENSASITVMQRTGLRYRGSCARYYGEELAEYAIAASRHRA